MKMKCNDKMSRPLVGDNQDIRQRCRISKTVDIAVFSLSKVVMSVGSLSSGWSLVHTQKTPSLL